MLWKAELDVLEGDHSDEKDADVRCMSRVNQIVSWDVRVNKIIISKLILYSMCNLNSIIKSINILYNLALDEFLSLKAYTFKLGYFQILLLEK